MSIVRHLIYDGEVPQNNDIWQTTYVPYFAGNGASSFVTKYFDSVETTGSGGTIRANFKIGSNVALYMGAADGIGSESGIKAWGLVTSNGEYYSEALGTYDTALRNPTIYTGTNATVISARYSNASYPAATYARILIVTKNNRGVTTIISKYGAPSDGSYIYQNIKCYALDDSVSETPRSDLTFTQVQSNQAQLIPFTSCAGSGVLSYTPNVFYITARNAPVADTGEVWFEVKFNGYNYLTNGYFAIKDDPIA